MRILVTGAGGFLGRQVVAAFLREGHQVRALLRPGRLLADRTWPGDVDLFRSDLRATTDLAPAFEGVDALVHLAACVIGSDSTHLATTVAGTERLLNAMARTRTRRLVLASTFSVYGWSAVRETLDESSPLESDLYERGGYAIAKSWQERVVRRMARDHAWDLTVLRPGLLWGPGNDGLALIGLQAGSFHLVIGPTRRLPLSYVENCADCFLRAALDPRAVGETLNVLDDEHVTTWQFLGEHLRRTGSTRTRVAIPYWFAAWIAQAAALCSRVLFKRGGKLPSLLMPVRLAVFKPLSFSNARLHAALDWRQPVRYAEALERSYPRS